MKHSLPVSEDELVAALKIRGQKAYSILYDCYAPTLLGILYKLVNDQAQAEMLLEELFVRIWNTIDTYDAGKGRLFMWLLTVTRNTATDFLQTQAATEQIEHLTLPGGTFSAPTTAVDVIESSTTDAETWLDPDHRRVIDLILFGGYSQQKVADSLKLTPGTVKMHTQKALQQLKALFRNAL